MIQHISIRDFAIIEHIEIDMHAGFNVITGETGSGKSIVIEAISLAFGARADRSMVRAGKDRAIIQLIIEGDADTILISREIYATGRSICRIDGDIVTLAQLSEASQRLADIHGQYDHQSLLYPENHISIIDSSDSRIDAALERTAKDYAMYAQLRKRLGEVSALEAASRRETDFIKYEIGEIEKAKLVEGEYAELKEQIAIMQNSERIFEALTNAAGAMSGDGGAVEQASYALSQLRGISEYSSDYAETEKNLDSTYYELEEAAERIKSALEHTDFSKRSIDDAIARLDTVERIVSKYGGGHVDENAETAVLAYLESAREKLDSIENTELRKAELTDELRSALVALTESSRLLHELRIEASDRLAEKVREQLAELNFTDADFRADFAEFPKSDADLEKHIGADGADRVEFVFTANKGQPLRPISKTASGGEMSRVMLAIKTVTGNFDSIPTMIFDEIDTGISGVTASIVGEKLKRMSELRQIICITHLPQIAAFSEHHYLIEKTSDESSTRATVREAAGEEKAAAIARLIGGKNITPTTLESARELIDAT